MTTNSKTALSFFGSQLRRCREQRKMTQEQLAKTVPVSASLVSMIENGQSPPQLDYAKKWDKALDTGGLLVSIIEDLLSVELAKDWFQEWVGYEQRATTIRTYQPLLIPGLLQTAEYMRAVLESSATSDEEIDQTIAARRARQDAVLSREKPPRLIALLDEYVLRRPIGGRDTMFGQLEHLKGIATRPNIRIQVIPTDNGMYEGLRGPVVLAEFAGEADVAYLDTAYKGVVIERVSDIAAVRTIWDSLMAEALPKKQSMNVLSAIAKEWTA